MLNRSPASTTPFMAPVISRNRASNSQTLVNRRMYDQEKMMETKATMLMITTISLASPSQTNSMPRADFSSPQPPT